VNDSATSAPVDGAPTVPAPASTRADMMALTKARLSGLVVITTLAGYWLGVERGGVSDGWRLAHTLFGTSLCAFGSAVFNQLIEIEPDARMARTADRPLPGQRIPAAAAFFIGLVLCGWGMVHLVNKVNVEAAAFAAATLVTYLFIYTPLKQRSSTNTLVGAVSGALPPVIGWAAAAGPDPMALGFRWEWLHRSEAWWLFALLFLWQLPHFLAINWMYRDDYRRAGFVMWSNDDDSGALTSALALLFTLCLLPVAVWPAMAGFSGWLVSAGMLVLTLWLLWLAVKFRRDRTRPAARRLFFATLAYLPIALILVLAGARES
jgi:protoheme IX farnesyltransferase